jgi:hypothetical protein
MTEAGTFARSFVVQLSRYWRMAGAARRGLYYKPRTLLRSARSAP